MTTNSSPLATENEMSRTAATLPTRASSARGRSAIAEPTMRSGFGPNTFQTLRHSRTGGADEPAVAPSGAAPARVGSSYPAGARSTDPPSCTLAQSCTGSGACPSSPELGHDRGEDGVEVADDGVVGLGDHRRILVGVDGQHPLGRHHPDPVLDGAGDAAGDVELGRDALAGLADLVGVGAPAVVGDDPRAPDRAAEQAGQLLQRPRSPRPSPRPGRRSPRPPRRPGCCRPRPGTRSTMRVRSASVGRGPG